MIGETILHYKIIEKLGEGGMGEVFKAQDTKLDRFVALKFLPAELTSSEDDKARFIQEAKAASAMNHPNVCTIHSIEEYNKQLFIVMEYIEGTTLRDNKQVSFRKEDSRNSSTGCGRFRSSARKRDCTPRYKARKHNDPKGRNCADNGFRAGKIIFFE